MMMMMKMTEAMEAMVAVAADMVLVAADMVLVWHQTGAALVPHQQKPLIP